MRGSVYFYKKLQLSSGTEKDKLLLQLNTPAGKDPCLLALTTSQKKNRPETPGCISSLSLFYIQAQRSCFDKNTWIQLDDIFELDLALMIKKGLNKELIEIGLLPKQKMNEIANCCKRCDDVTEYNLQLILKSKEA